MTLSVSTFNDKQDLIKVTDNTATRNNIVDSNDEAKALKPFAIYQSGFIVPYTDPIFRMLRDRLTHEPEPQTRIIADLQQAFEITIRKSIVDKREEALDIFEGNVVITTVNPSPRKSFPREQLAYEITWAFRGRKTNPHPPEIVIDASPSTLDYLHKNGFTLKHTTFTWIKPGKKPVSFDYTGGPRYFDLAEAIYLAPHMVGKHPFVKIVTVTKGGKNLVEYIDLKIGKAKYENEMP